MSFKVTFADESGDGPSLTSFNNLFVLGWSGKDDDNLYLTSSSDAQTWSTPVSINGQSSKSTPAIVEMGGVLYIAWADTSSDHYLHVTQTSDLKTFATAVTLEESLYKGTGPALAVFNDVLYVAWSDSNYTLNVGQYSNGQIVVKSTLDQKTAATPALAADDDYLYLAWTGTNADYDLLDQDTDNNLNAMRSSDGTTFTTPSVLGSAATWDATIGPGLTVYDGKLYIGWADVDDGSALHLAYSTDQGAVFGGETIDKDNSSPYGIAICSNLVAWTGTDNKVNLQDAI